jgi:hypothetical protein
VVATLVDVGQITLRLIHCARWLASRTGAACTRLVQYHMVYMVLTSEPPLRRPQHAARGPVSTTVTAGGEGERASDLSSGAAPPEATGDGDAGDGGDGDEGGLREGRQNNGGGGGLPSGAARTSATWLVLGAALLVPV